ncbi:fra a 1-associated protein isoform X1 [Malania oleifera]|uniref:fra a 1-associated protein isoform X1 n=1 Tax=Malania oleifera TaxID=397392 RepID=UPI0025ADBC67|nr:fra a 1-associated protein isoform X1 [Malania oleifera]
MGWVWKDEEDGGWSSSAGSGDTDNSLDPSPMCSTRRIVKSQCKTEEVEPGKFVRRCEKTEEILKDCVGRPTEVVQSNKEYTEDDVTGEVVKGSLSFRSSEQQPFDFPGLRSDIESIERNVFGGLDRFFEAAEEMKNGFFSVFGAPHIYDGISSSPPSRRQGIPIEDHVKPNDLDRGHVDLSGLAREV